MQRLGYSITHTPLKTVKFSEQRCSLLASVNDVLEACGYSEGAHINMLQLLLCRNKNLPLEANKIILNRPFSYSEKESQSNDILLQFVEFSNVHNRSSNATRSNFANKNVIKITLDPGSFLE